MKIIINILNCFINSYRLLAWKINLLIYVQNHFQCLYSIAVLHFRKSRQMLSSLFSVCVPLCYLFFSFLFLLVEDIVFHFRKEKTHHSLFEFQRDTLVFFFCMKVALIFEQNFTNRILMLMISSEGFYRMMHHCTAIVLYNICKRYNVV